jgi:hypothetical protein
LINGPISEALSEFHVKPLSLFLINQKHEPELNEELGWLPLSSDWESAQKSLGWKCQRYEAPRAGKRSNAATQV